MFQVLLSWTPLIEFDAIEKYIIVKFMNRVYATAVHWTSNSIFCLGSTTLPTHTNAMVTSGNDGTYAQGDMLTYTCNSGYVSANPLVCSCNDVSGTDTWVCNPAENTNPCQGKEYFYLSNNFCFGLFNKRTLWFIYNCCILRIWTFHLLQFTELNAIIHAMQ